METEQPEILESAPIIDLKVARKMLSLHSSAKSRGLEYNLSFRTVKRLLTQKRCFYTKTPFGENEFKRTIDRVDASKGYIEGNVVACTVSINLKKANLTIKEIMMLSDAIRKLNLNKEI